MQPTPSRQTQHERSDMTIVLLLAGGIGLAAWFLDREGLKARHAKKVAIITAVRDEAVGRLADDLDAEVGKRYALEAALKEAHNATTLALAELDLVTGVPAVVAPVIEFPRSAK